MRGVPRGVGPLVGGFVFLGWGGVPLWLSSPKVTSVLPRLGRRDFSANFFV